MILVSFGLLLFYLFDGLVVVALIQALGNEELDFVALLAVGAATVVLSVFLDLMLANEWGSLGYFGACGVTALVLGLALKLLWDVEIKRVVLVCVFFCAFHVGMLLSLKHWASQVF